MRDPLAAQKQPFSLARRVNGRLGDEIALYLAVVLFYHQRHQLA
jgi:hypothetical protein